MKKALLFAAVCLLAAACTKQTPSVQDLRLSVSEESGSDLTGRDFSVYVVAKKSSSVSPGKPTIKSQYVSIL